MQEKIRKIISRYGRDNGFLVPILQDVQNELNYLPEEALELVARMLEIPASRVFEVATFYKAFSLQPRGRHQLSLCLGTACHVRGAPRISDHIQEALGIGAGETTPDLEFTFETVGCLGACALAPVMTVDGEYHGPLTIAKTNAVLQDLGRKEAPDEKA